MGFAKKLKRNKDMKSGKLEARKNARAYSAKAYDTAKRIVDKTRGKVGPALTDRMMCYACNILMKQFNLSAKTCFKFIDGITDISDSINRRYISLDEVHDVVRRKHNDGINYKHVSLGFDREEYLNQKYMVEGQDLVVAMANAQMAERMYRIWYNTEAIFIYILHDRHRFGKKRLDEFISRLREHDIDVTNDMTEHITYLRERGMDYKDIEQINTIDIKFGKVSA